MTPSKLSAARFAAQSEMKNPGFDATNPHFKSRYASLAEVRKVVLPVLAKHGLFYSESPAVAEGRAGVYWKLEHVETGEFVEDELMIPLDKPSAHGVGSAITYARRFNLQTIGGVVAENDDDGNEASVPTKPAEPRFASGPPVGATAGNDALKIATAKAQLGSKQAQWKAAGKLSAFEAMYAPIAARLHIAQPYNGPAALFEQFVAEICAVPVPT